MGGKPRQSAWDLAAKLPPRFYLRIQPEIDEDDNTHLGACIYKEPPFGGWGVGCDYFGHVPDVHRRDDQCGWNTPDFPWKHDDSVIVGTTASDALELHENTRTMLEYFFREKLGPGDE